MAFCGWKKFIPLMEGLKMGDKNVGGGGNFSWWDGGNEKIFGW